MSGGDNLSTSASGLVKPDVLVLLVVVPHVSRVLFVLCLDLFR